MSTAVALDFRPYLGPLDLTALGMTGCGSVQFNSMLSFNIANSSMLGAHN